MFLSYYMSFSQSGTKICTPTIYSVSQFESAYVCVSDCDNTHMQYTVNFICCKNDNFQMKYFDMFLIFAQNIDCGYTLEPRFAVLTCTNNLCFRAKVRKNVYPCYPQFYYIKVGYKWVYITRTCYHGERSPINFVYIYVLMEIRL